MHVYFTRFSSSPQGDSAPSAPPAGDPSSRLMVLKRLVRLRGRLAVRQALAGATCLEPPNELPETSGSENAP